MIKPSKLDEAIDLIWKGVWKDGKVSAPEARKLILALIEEVISSDEPEMIGSTHLNGPTIRNKLRAEQRLKKDNL